LTISTLKKWWSLELALLAHTRKYCQDFLRIPEMAPTEKDTLFTTFGSEIVRYHCCGFIKGKFHHLGSYT
jgi:hypothetical protein